MYINLQKVARRKSMSKRYEAAKRARADAMWDVQKNKALRLLKKLASVRLNAGDERHTMSSFVLSFPDSEWKSLFQIIKKVNQLTDDDKSIYSHYAAMLKTYPDNCEWKAQLCGVVCVSFRYYDDTCVPLHYRINPKKNFDEFCTRGHLPIMDRLCQFLSRPYAMALCMVLFPKWKRL